VAIGETGDDARYWAFISYSHKDAAFGRRLHGRLERYAIPRRLVGRETSRGTVPRKIAPVFRDREELSAAHDLSAEVRAALCASRSLIVICSPAAAASRWVAREVEVFRALHPDRPILAAIRDGEPPGCFPETLRPLGPDGVAVEPLAADFRRGRDGERLGLLKLVSGVLGIGLDELVQRDAHRRLQRVTAVTAGALAAMLAMGVLTVFAINARLEADRQRGEAEGLVEYMLTDLRDRLKGVGRLDVMTGVNERALHYYAEENLDTLPANSLERRARVLHAMGEDDESRGDHDAALRKFHEAYRTTQRLLALAPNDPERIFDHAQSAYWIGFVDFDRERYVTAKPWFREYKALVDRLIGIAPDNPRFQREAAYAAGGLCAIAIYPPKDPAGALSACGSALAHMEAAAHHSPPSSAIQADIASRHAWLADAYRINHDNKNVWKHRLIQEQILNTLISSDPKNMDLKVSWLGLQRSLARMTAEAGKPADALARLEHALSVVNDMIRFDPTNKSWARMQRKILTDTEELKGAIAKGRH
jgi:hypothetical protein